MSKNDTPVTEAKMPLGQRLFDRPFIWLTLGMVTMLVFYTLWGIYEIASVPPATLP